MPEIIHKELCYQLYAIFYTIQNKLGRMCKERQYADAIELFFKARKIPYKREVEIPIIIKEGKITGNRVDFIIKGLILIDAKAKKYISREDYRQMKRYLRATNLKLGLIVNFRERSIKPKRIINSQGKK